MTVYPLQNSEDDFEPMEKNSIRMGLEGIRLGRTEKRKFETCRKGRGMF
jgi:hypothetical protein